ncbi:MAG TPA: alpha/beta fold hydrolase [Aggregatilineaceae bacterium]|jgi:pimeloyl-ACP methyl ester carboxylesterase|nr:alpha/beta fold hydrolase [Aggregatilineaceae bacterium]
MCIRLLISAALLLVLIGFAAPAAAQDIPEPQRVEVTASDGLTLVGDFFAASDAASDTGAPAALLLHQLGASKSSWGSLIPALYDAGYTLLAVDLRGHGETGGGLNWPLAEQDTQTWLEWLRAQPGVDPERVSIIGSSIGSNLALRGMADDARVVTAVAISPGLDYFGVTTQDAIQAIGQRPVFLVTAQRDMQSAAGVKTLATVVQGDALVRIYPGNAHGISLFSQGDFIPMIVSWLDTHSR